MFTLEDFLSKMHVAEIDTFLFSGEPLQMGLPRVFGGQVLGQALNAAVRTVDPERRPHSLHAYFLRPGDITRSIIYEVDPIRDGRSFSTRRVVAKQGGKAIFNASMSFQIAEDGLDHQIDLPAHIPSPEDILPDIEHAEKLGKDHPEVSVETLRRKSLVFDPSVVEIRTPDLFKSVVPGEYDPEFGYWFKFSNGIGDDPITHRTLLAFMSDKALMSVGMMPHIWNRETHRMIGASLDHAMWFHSEIRVNQWIYYHIDSPRAARARDFGRGSFYTQSGELIASTAQEGLIRIVEKPAG
jgi:acyl-CoA thioesterase-2